MFHQGGKHDRKSTHVIMNPPIKKDSFFLAAPGGLVSIPTSDLEQKIVESISRFTATLAGSGLEVSTGEVVDFRLRDDLRSSPEPGAVPLLYAAHFRSGKLKWPTIST